jgi:hypothetical protein
MGAADRCVPDYTRLETTCQGTVLSMAEVLRLVQDATNRDSVSSQFSTPLGH